VAAAPLARRARGEGRIMTLDKIWLGIGFLGQGLFSARFLVQWLASERARRSIIPMMFWYFSLLGGVTLLSYAIYKQDPVFIVGQSFGLIVYLRNLWLIKTGRQKAEA
jgi:lipid-A-disaccharide synthase-like uncharacterized protein